MRAAIRGSPPLGETPQPVLVLTVHLRLGSLGQLPLLLGREDPLDVRMPEPVVDRADGTDPEHEALLADSVGLALLVVLETLSPPERLAFVLHDMLARLRAVAAPTLRPTVSPSRCREPPFSAATS